MNIINMNKVGVGESVLLTIHAKQIYSSERISVSAGETYLISAEPNQRWKDWLINTTPKGFFNPLAILAGLRLKRTPCFCLCGAYNENEKHLFAIGLDAQTTVPARQSSLSFFANDAIRHYDNNSGSIKIKVYRVR
ncbi:hypothetical protein [Emticicia soli]|uniref:Uncharacterized protein n=1 Tax=Emticicia soli TaxID=2027878 RepID=A0ABW5JDC1_9BACT